MSAVPQILARYENDILANWMQEMSGAVRRSDLLKEGDVRRDCARFLSLVREAARSGNLQNPTTAEWGEVRSMLKELSRTRATQGFSPSDTATFVLSLKRPVTVILRKEFGNNPDALFAEIENANQMIDQLGLYTTEAFLKSREEVIARQQQDMLELSTPVVRLWEGILALPLIGTLDSARTQVVMEALLTRIVETNSLVAIIDITGVPTVDTLVAQHLLKTVTAARLMGAECIISGIRPQIAQTIVHLGVNLSDVTTKAALGDAFLMALDRTGFEVSKKTAIQG
jgi:rsbT co-antagonist protein RsbR